MDYSFLKNKKETKSAGTDYSFLAPNLKTKVVKKEVVKTIDKTPDLKVIEADLEKQGIKQGVMANLPAGVGKVFTDIGGAIKTGVKKVVSDLKEETSKTPEDKAKEYSARALLGLEGGMAKEMETKKFQEGTALATTDDLAEYAKKNEEKTEKVGNIFTAPIRWTAGSLATALVSLGLQTAKGKTGQTLEYDPKTDAEKLLIGENKIKPLLEQEDLYGTIARGAGVPSALATIAIIENPFLQGTGISAGIKNLLKNKLAKEGEKAILNMGATEIVNFADEAIKKELKANNILDLSEVQKFKAKEQIDIVKKDIEQLVTQKKPIIKTEVLKPGQYSTINEGGVKKVVDGKPIKIIDGVDTFIHKGDNPKLTIKGFVVSEKSTGRYLGSGNTEREAIVNAKSAIDNIGEDKFKQLISENQLVKGEAITPKVGEVKVEEPLISEAKKYKTAEEFVNGADLRKSIINKTVKPTDTVSVFHGTPYWEDIISGGKGIRSGVRRNTPSALGGRVYASDGFDNALTFSKDQPVAFRLETFYDNLKSDITTVKNSGIKNTVEDSLLKGGAITLPNDSFGIKSVVVKSPDGQIFEFPYKTRNQELINKIKDVIYGKSQLTDIWNKAQEVPKTEVKPIKTGKILTEPSIPKRIENETIEKGLKADFTGIEDYDKVSFKDQAKLVGDIIDEDPEKAIRIALGKELPTNGALPESVFIAVKNQALKKNDTELLIKLATEEGGVAKESTILGQRIKMLDEQLEDDAFTNIKKVVKNRQAKIEKGGKKLSEVSKAEKSKMKTEIKKVIAKKDEWADFVNSLKC